MEARGKQQVWEGGAARGKRRGASGWRSAPDRGSAGVRAGNGMDGLIDANGRSPSMGRSTTRRRRRGSTTDFNLRVTKRAPRCDSHVTHNSYCSTSAEWEGSILPFPDQRRMHPIIRMHPHHASEATLPDAPPPSPFSPPTRTALPLCSRRATAPSLLPTHQRSPASRLPPPLPRPTPTFSPAGRCRATRMHARPIPLASPPPTTAGGSTHRTGGGGGYRHHLRHHHHHLRRRHHRRHLHRRRPRPPPSRPTRRTCHCAAAAVDAPGGAAAAPGGTRRRGRQRPPTGRRRPPAVGVAGGPAAAGRW